MRNKIKSFEQRSADFKIFGGFLHDGKEIPPFKTFSRITSIVLNLKVTHCAQVRLLPPSLITKYYTTQFIIRTYNLFRPFFWKVILKFQFSPFSSHAMTLIS